MFNKCKHKWEEVRRTFTSGGFEAEVESVRGIQGIELLKELAFGRTNIELKCSECGDIAFRSVIGKS